MQFPIRELTFGAGKTGKTKNKVETYPKPMLVLNTELGGLASVKSIAVKEIKSEELPAFLAKPKAELPPVLVINYIYGASKQLSTTVAPTYSSDTLIRLVNDLNKLSSTCPFNCVILDHLTGLSDACVGLVGAQAPGLMADARKWAGAAGAKVQEIINFMLGLPAPCVVILAHSATTTNEKTGDTATLPMTVGSLKERISSMVEQCFHSDTITDNGKLKYVIRTVPVGLVKGLGHKGLRDDMPAVCDPYFKSIYGDWMP